MSFHDPSLSDVKLDVRGKAPFSSLCYKRVEQVGQVRTDRAEVGKALCHQELEGHGVAGQRGGKTRGAGGHRWTKGWTL